MGTDCCVLGPGGMASRMVAGIIEDAVYSIGGVGGSKVVAAAVDRDAGNVFEVKLGDHEDLLPF